MKILQSDCIQRGLVHISRTDNYSDPRFLIYRSPGKRGLAVSSPISSAIYLTRQDARARALIDIFDAQISSGHDKNHLNNYPAAFICIISS